MPFIDVAELPAVKEIMRDAIAQIQAITGMKVCLNIYEEEDPALVKKHLLKLAVCKTYNVSWAKVRSSRREVQSVRARHAYAFIANIYLLQSQEDTANDIGGLRSNVSATVKKVKGYFRVNDPEALIIKSIIDKLKL